MPEDSVFEVDCRAVVSNVVGVVDSSIGVVVGTVESGVEGVRRSRRIGVLVGTSEAIFGRLRVLDGLEPEESGVNR